MSEDFDQLFADETAKKNKDSKVSSFSEDGCWKILIVDDDPGIHIVTRLALDGLFVDGKGLCFLEARSMPDAISMLQSEPDLSLALIDAALESDDSGLQLSRFIREDLKNERLRLILKTGSPWQIPDKNIIDDYDISDYKEKSELTSSKLFSAVINGIRSYRNLVILDAARIGLKKISEISVLFQRHRKRTEDLLRESGYQLNALMSDLSDLLQIKSECFFAIRKKSGFELIASENIQSMSHENEKLIFLALQEKKKVRSQSDVCFPVSTGKLSVCLYVRSDIPIPDVIQDLIDLYGRIVESAVVNAEMYSDTLKEISSDEVRPS